MAHHCEPTRYPDTLFETWDCPVCGTEYTAFDPDCDDLMPGWVKGSLVPKRLGWAAYGGHK